MRAMVLERQPGALRPAELAPATCGPGQVRISVGACGICRTDLHIVDGELTQPKLPLVPGHQIAGTVLEVGAGVERWSLGDRVGVPWLAWTCGTCAYCRSGRELAPLVPVRTEVETHPLGEANLALERLRSGAVRGSGVLLP